MSTYTAGKIIGTIFVLAIIIPLILASTIYYLVKRVYMHRVKGLKLYQWKLPSHVSGETMYRYGWFSNIFHARSEMGYNKLPKQIYPTPELIHPQVK